MKVFGYERRTKEKHGIHQHRHTYIEREYRVIVSCRRSLYIDESLRKACTLKVGRNGGEDCEYAYDSVISLGQMTSKDDADYEIKYLGCSAIERPPEQAFRRFLL